MNTFFLSIVVTGCSLIALKVYAHSGSDNENLKSYLQASASISYRSDSSTPKDEAYQIPGAAMGAQALPYNEGGRLDDAQISAGYAVNDVYRVSAVLNSHEHDGSHEVELENLWIASRYNKLPVELWFDLGKTSTNTTKSASWHASRSRFSEASLISDVFFGRHFNDTGLRAILKTASTQLGLEFFSGDSWPAEKNEGAMSIYLKTQPSWLGKTSEIGIWGMNTRAEDRSDSRYDEGHSHGNDVVSTTSDYSFTGDIEIFGTYVTSKLPLDPLFLLFEAEWIQSKSDGTLSNATQTIDYENEYTGTRFMLGMEYKDHALFTQYEALTLDNHFFGDVTTDFITDAGLMNNGFEPNKLTLAWHWQLQESLTLKVEYVDLHSTSEKDSNQHFVAGLVWSHSFNLDSLR